MRTDILFLMRRPRWAWQVGLAVLLGAMVGSGPAQANTVNLSLTYTVVQGTCTTSAGISSTGTGRLDFGALSYKTGLPTWSQIGGAKPFNVYLSNCSGASDPATTPLLTIDASTETASWAQATTNDMAALYVSRAGSTAKGFGFAIYPDAKGTASQYISKQGSGGVRTTIPIPNYTSKGSVIMNSVVVPLSAAVTCGDSCVNISVQTLGTLQAFVTFSLVYQ